MPIGDYSTQDVSLAATHDGKAFSAPPVSQQTVNPKLFNQALVLPTAVTGGAKPQGGDSANYCYELANTTIASYSFLARTAGAPQSQSYEISCQFVAVSTAPAFWFRIPIFVPATSGGSGSLQLFFAMTEMVTAHGAATIWSPSTVVMDDNVVSNKNQYTYASNSGQQYFYSGTGILVPTLEYASSGYTCTAGHLYKLSLGYKWISHTPASAHATITDPMLIVGASIYSNAPTAAW